LLDAVGTVIGELQGKITKLEAELKALKHAKP
jgi:hypothetical protein